MKVFKKSIFTLPLAFALLQGILTAFADEAAEKAATVLSQVEIINYIVYAGIALFVLGFIFVLISFYIKTKHKDEPEEESYYIPENEESLDGGEEISEESEDAEDDIDKSEESEEPEETDEAEEVEDAEESEESKKSDKAENDKKPEESEASKDAEEAPVDAQTEIAEESPDETSAEAPKEEKAEEKEPSNQIIKITLSGINSMDLKMAELQTSITIGRKPANDIFISDNSVSGKHCLISRTDNEVFIEDLDSTNGTIINGEMISEKTPLSSGDTLILGKQTYKVHISK